MRRLQRTALALASLTLVAGCGGAPEASPPPPPASPSESPSTSETPAPPSVPPGITRRGEEGALAASRYFFSTMTYAGTTGRTDEFRSSFTDFCTRCAGIAEVIEETYLAGGSIEGGQWVLEELEFYGITGGIAAVDAVVDVEPQVWTRSRGRQPETYPGEPRVLKALQLEWREPSGWAVAALDPEG